MLFMCHGKPKPGLTTEDRRQVLKLFAGWQPPAALQIKGHWIAADGSDYVVVETDSVACLIEATGIWAPYVDYVGHLRDADHGGVRRDRRLRARRGPAQLDPLSRGSRAARYATTHPARARRRDTHDARCGSGD
jgi:hypothetical protein